MSSYLKINNLILVGTRKNYIIEFNEGVNIIYGDSATGKSTILEFINYLLGSSSIELADEVIMSVKYAALEITINGIEYTIKRNIYDNRALIEVYKSSFISCENNYPHKYAPNYSIEAPNGFYSDFLLDSLDFPKLKIKVSPSKENSDMKRLGFRSIFKYCYINQDDVGSKSLLNYGNWSLFTTNMEVFKYIFNVLDISISELSSEISEKKKKSQSLKDKYISISEFLRETDYENSSSIDQSIKSIDITLNQLKEELKQVNNAMTHNSKQYNEIKSIFDNLLLKKKKATINIKSLEEGITKFSRLKNDYQNDLSKIKSIKLSKELIGENLNSNSRCPICDSIISLSEENTPYQIVPKDSLEDELKSLKRRMTSIDKIISSQSLKHKEESINIHVYDEDINKARHMLDTESSEMITPYLTQRDTLVKEISKLQQVKISYSNNIKIRNKHKEIHDLYITLDESIEKLKITLKELQENSPDINEILDILGTTLYNYLKSINIQNLHDIKINEKNFLPVFRDKEYYNITSGGLRTIISIGHMLGIIDFSIDNNINHPRLLMIDTVGKYLGKTTNEEYLSQTDITEDKQEKLSDPHKYKKIYENVIDIAAKAKDVGEPCQVILVDNDVPETVVENYKGYIVAHFSPSNSVSNKPGLIDDINL